MTRRLIIQTQGALKRSEPLPPARIMITSSTVLPFVSGTRADTKMKLDQQITAKSPNAPCLVSVSWSVLKTKVTTNEDAQHKAVPRALREPRASVGMISAKMSQG